MTQFEYKVIPAPSKGRKAPGVKGAEARFAFGVQEVMNEMGAEGWQYLRSDLLPSEERQGLTSSQTVYRSVLVFQRPRTDAVSDEITEGPAEAAPEPQDSVLEPETLNHSHAATDNAVPDEPASEVDPMPPHRA